MTTKIDDSIKYFEDLIEKIDDSSKKYLKLLTILEKFKKLDYSNSLEEIIT